jgi:hypothetical protein
MAKAEAGLEVLAIGFCFNLAPEQYLQDKLKTAQNSLWEDDNFLKKSFLEAYRDADLFDGIYS